MNIKVVRVWGTADNFDIEFSHEGGDRWNCSIPPDVSDGAYAVELFAINEHGKKAHWVGELFMSSGVCRLTIIEKDYDIWFDCDDISVSVSENTSGMSISKRYPKYSLFVDDDSSRLIISKGCPHKGGGYDRLL